MTEAAERKICEEIHAIWSVHPLDLVKLRRIFLLFAQSHYSSARHYGAYEEKLCGLVYNPDDSAAGGLKVALADTFDPKSEDQAPAVYIQFNGYNFTKLSINNSGDTSEIGDRTEYFHKADIEMSLLAVADKSLDTAFYLAETGYDFFCALRPGLMDFQTLGLLMFDPVSLLKREPKNQQPDKYFQVEAKFKMTLQLTVARLHESHLLKKVALYATQTV